MLLLRTKSSVNFQIAQNTERKREIKQLVPREQHSVEKENENKKKKLKRTFFSSNFDFVNIKKKENKFIDLILCQSAQFATEDTDTDSRASGEYAAYSVE